MANISFPTRFIISKFVMRYALRAGPRYINGKRRMVAMVAVNPVTLFALLLREVENAVTHIRSGQLGITVVSPTTDVGVRAPRVLAHGLRTANHWKIGLRTDVTARLCATSHVNCCSDRNVRAGAGGFLESGRGSCREGWANELSDSHDANKLKF